MAFVTEDVRFLGFPKIQETKTMRKVVLFLAVIVAGSPVFAQQIIGAKVESQPKTSEENFGPDAPSHDQVMTLLDLLRVRKAILGMMDGMKQVMKQGAEKSFRQDVPNPTPKQLAALSEIIDGAIGDTPIDEMVEAIVPIYRRHLTKSDVEEMIRFYDSPVGQKLLREQPQMLQESLRAGAAIQEKRMDQIMIKVREASKKLAEANEEKSTTPAR